MIHCSFFSHDRPSFQSVALCLFVVSISDCPSIVSVSDCSLFHSVTFSELWLILCEVTYETIMSGSTKVKVSYFLSSVLASGPLSIVQS